MGSAAKSGTKFSNKHPADVEQAVATHRATCVRWEGIIIQTKRPKGGPLTIRVSLLIPNKEAPNMETRRPES